METWLHVGETVRRVWRCIMEINENLVFRKDKSQESQGKVNYLKNEKPLGMYLNDRVAS
jgi:hypothetical protein